MEMDKVWWNHIIKPKWFLNQMVECILKKKSVVLFVPKVIPWYNSMIELIEEQLHKESADYAFEMIESPIDDKEVGEFLLEKYCKKEKRATYRPAISYAKFLGGSEDIVLHNRFIWVRHITKEKYEEWCNFIVEYKKTVGENRACAVFILEIMDPSIERLKRKNIDVMIYENIISEYDRYTFCALLASEINIKENLKQYLADLVASVCGNNIELCAMCIQKGIWFLKDPNGVLTEVLEQECREEGNCFDLKETGENIQNIIWNSQLRIFFPIIENYRSSFIHQYKAKFEKFLPVQNIFGEAIENVQDMEIGILCYLLEKEEFLLDVKEKEYEKLNHYRNARNKLAHLESLSFDVIEEMML